MLLTAEDSRATPYSEPVSRSPNSRSKLSAGSGDLALSCDGFRSECVKQHLDTYLPERYSIVSTLISTTRLHGKLFRSSRAPIDNSLSLSAAGVLLAFRIFISSLGTGNSSVLALFG